MHIHLWHQRLDMNIIGVTILSNLQYRVEYSCRIEFLLSIHNAQTTIYCSYT